MVVKAIAQIKLSEKLPGDFLVGGLRPVALVNEFSVTFFATKAASGVKMGPSSLALKEVDLFAIDSIVAERIYG
jgi:hypothetical protein